VAARDGESVNEVPRNANVDLGDADAVEKTTYLGDRHGADVGGKADAPVAVSAPVRSERGLGPIGWVATLLALLALAIYAAGLFD